MQALLPPWRHFPSSPNLGPGQKPLPGSGAAGGEQGKGGKCFGLPEPIRDRCASESPSLGSAITKGLLIHDPNSRHRPPSDFRCLSGNFMLSKASESLEGRKSREEERGTYLLTNAPQVQGSQRWKRLVEEGLWLDVWEIQLPVGILKGPCLWEDVLVQNITPLQTSEGAAETLSIWGHGRGATPSCKESPPSSLLPPPSGRDTARRPSGGLRSQPSCPQ